MADLGAILDIDGTLVDSVYEHTRAWYEAFRAQGIIVPEVRIHRAIGMGGDKLVPYLLDVSDDDPRVESLKEAHGATFKREYFAGILAIPEATAYVRRLKDAGYRIALA